MRVAALLAVVLSTAAACGSDADSDAGPNILPPDAEVDGMDAAELLAAYDAAVFGVPLADSMLDDPSKCDMGQSTDKVYYSPTFGVPGETTASCTMNADQVLLLNPVGYICLEEGEESADTDCLDQAWDLTSSSVTVNGQSVEDLAQRELDSDVFSLELPQGNVFDLPPGPYDAISRGQVVLVNDLPVGDHTIVLGGDFGDGEFAGSLTINLTVED